MDPQIISDLREQISQLTNIVSKQTAAVTGLSNTITSATNALNSAGAQVKKSTNAQNENTSANAKTTQALTPLAATEKKAGELAAEAAANFKLAVISTTDAVKSFSQSVLSGEQGFTKYGGAMKGLGDAAYSLGKSFGLLGGILGGIAKVGSEVAAHMAKQADAIGTATDTIAQIGAANAFTMDQVRQLGANAGLTSFELDKLTKPMQSVKGGLAALGGTQAEGVKKFAQLANVSKDVRAEFRRLGMGDQERNQALADYLSTMNKSGAAFDGTLRTQKGLQKAALAYTRNLYELAEITGESVEDEQHAREQQMDTMETALQQQKWAEQTAAAEAAVKNGTPEERKAAQADLDRISNEKAGYEQMNNDLRQAKLNPEQVKSMQRAFLRGGQLDESAAQFTIMGMNPQEYIVKARQNKIKKGQFAKDFSQKGQDTLNTIGIVGMGASEEAKNAVAIGDKEALKRQNQMLTTDYEKQAGEAYKKTLNPDNANDPAQRARDIEVETSRALKLRVDALEAAHNPFLKGTKILDNFKDLGSVAVTALLGLAAAAGGITVFKMFKGSAGKEAIKDVEKFSLKSLGKGILRGGGKLLKGGAIVAGVVAAGYGLGKLTGFDVGSMFGGEETDSQKPDMAQINDEATEAMQADISDVPEENQVKPEDQANKKLQEINKMIVVQSTKLNDLNKQVFETSGKLAEKEKAQELSLINKFKFDPKKIEENSAAIAAYQQSLSTTADLTGVDISSLADSISNFDKVSPKIYDAMQHFSTLNIDKNKTADNAEAFSSFAKAMASFTGYGDTPNKSKDIATATSLFFEQVGNLMTFTYFSNLPINPKQAKDNATSFVKFSHAMLEYKGGIKLLDAVSSIAGAKLTRLFGQDSPIEAFINFVSDMDRTNINENKVLKTTTAFLNFSKALGMLSGGSSGILSSVAGGVVSAAAAAVGFIGGTVTAIGGLLGKIIKAESGGNASAAAKTSSAYGLGQFTKGAFEGLAKQKGSPVFGVSWDEYKRNPDVQMKALEYLVKQNQAFLAKSGIPVNDASTYLAHFLGPGGARNIYRHADSESLSQVVSPSAYNANRSVFDKAKTVGGLKAWASKKMGGPELQARAGGIMSGPMTGYPVEMHGTELIIPNISMDSLLVKLSNPNATGSDVNELLHELQAVTHTAIESEPSGLEFLNPVMIAALANKFDRAISILRDSDNVQGNYLKHISV